MTTETLKRFAVAGIVLVLAACVAVCCAVAGAGRPAAAAKHGWDYAALGLVMVLVGLLVAHRRRSESAAREVAGQLDQMARSRRMGLVMVPGSRQTARLAAPLNRLLTTTQEGIDQLRAENRELQIQSHIADAEKRHTEAIVFSISDAVIVVNRFDELILANDAAEKLLSFKLAHSLRKSVDHILQDGTLVRLIRETRNSGRSSTRKVVEHTIDRKGQPRTYNVTLSCVMAAQGEVSGVVAVLHDVTREKEIAQMKTDFVSSVSHELRTPLASIKAYVEMLQDGEAGDPQMRGEFYRIIAAEADRLERLIDNILNISRIESGVVRVVREGLCLRDLARRVLDVMAPQAKAKKITLVGRLGPVGRHVEADKDMIYQAVVNLVGNAIKYTPEGGQVTVSTSVDERRGLAVCQVSDTGVGISPDSLPHIFDKFYRIRGHTKMAKGTGLGLTLVKHIVETVHEGKLSVTSETGKGSAFTFELPVVD